MKFNNHIQFIPALNLHRDNTIADAFKAINGRFGMIVTVVEGDNRLCGVLSEGNLRKAILSGNPLDMPLEKVMNDSPITIRLDDLEDELKRTNVIDHIYHRYGNTHGQQARIPVVDEKGSVIGLIIPEMLQIRGKHNISAGNKKPGSPRVLVVGGAGYIGSVFVRMLLDEGWRVRVLDNMLYNQASLNEIDSENFSLVRGDVTNINDLIEAIEEVDAVVYLAEIVGDAACAYKPERTLKTNYLSVTNMANLCAYLNVNRFIYTSSCSVYGGSEDPNKYLSEESELNPLSYYGRMKIMSEQALLGNSNPLFAPTILRLATVFGNSPRPRFDLVVNTFANNAFFKKCIKVLGGNQWRPNIYVRDASEAIMKVLEAPIGKVSRQTFNVGSSSQNYTINELAELVIQVFPEAKIERDHRKLDPRNYKVDFSKIEKELGYSAQFSVLDGLRELKTIFEKGEIKDTDNLKYSNFEALRVLDREK